MRNAATGANTDVGMIFYNDGAGTLARIKAYDAGTYNGGLIFEYAPTAGSLNNNTSESFRINHQGRVMINCLLYTSPSPRDNRVSRMPSSA